MGERLDTFKRIQSGEVRIVIGTRSAVFAPLRNIGLIVMDEEQENTYQSEMTPRYHTRQIAKFRCAHHNALLLLSSATPSVESFYQAQKGQYHFFKLEQRYNRSVLPSVQLVDMRDEQKNGNITLFSKVLLDEIRINLNKKEQTILLLNRRGYNTFISCANCGDVVTCPNCSIAMTYHIANHQLMCHCCGTSQPVVRYCQKCGSKYVKYQGIGTQKAEEQLQALLPQARILRMDTDTTMSRFAHEKLFSQFEAGGI